MSEPSWRERGFPGMTGLAEARSRLLSAVEPLDRSEPVTTAAADGRVLAEPIDAARSVPHYRRAAMDGFAVRAEDTSGASEDAPVSLRRQGGDVDPDTAVPVQTGEPIPPGADSVVRVERTDTRDDEVAVFAPVEPGKDVAPVGEDVTAGQRLYEAGHRLRPSDLGLLTSVGQGEVSVVATPAVRVLPTGGELVHADPADGEVVETNGVTVSRYVERWGGTPILSDPVDDDPDVIAGAIERATSGDVVVTTGGSSVGERDVVPGVIDDLGELLVHGVAIKPGHPLALGVVDGTPILALPGYPVSTIVTAVQFLRPVLGRLGRLDPPAHPSTEATLTTAIETEPGVTAFERVSVANRDGDRVAEPVEAAGAGVLSSVALADGWVVVSAGSERLSAGSVVPVEDWEPPC